jgi:HK97 family phage portal protein
MPLFTRFSKWMASRRSDATVTVAPDVVVSGAPFGVSVTNQAALKVTAFYAGIRIRSENIASFPKYVKRMTKDGLVDDKRHPAYKVINVRPNSYTNKFDFWNVINTWLDGWGNAYALIQRDGDGDPVALHQIHPTWVVGITIVDGKKWYKVQSLDKDFQWLNGTYSDDDMLHFMLVTLDGIKGVNPVIYNALALGKSLATEKFASEFYERGGNLKAVLETEGHLGDEEFNAFMTHFKKSARNFETPLLEYGVKYKQLSVNPVAAALIQSETLSIQDVCRIINIPPHMVAELAHATFSNIEHQTIQFVQYSLRPTVKRLEDELERKLFTESEQEVYSVKFSLDGLLRGDTQARSSYYHNAILDGYMSRNEVREMEGLQHKDGLDDMLYPLNTGVVGKEPEDPNA